VEAYTDYAFQYGLMLQTYELLKDRNSRFCDWENKQTSKFVFKDRIIQPIQRLPRYGLYIKDLLKHTPVSHDDHELLLRAERQIATVTEKVDRMVGEAQGGFSLFCPPLPVHG